MASDSERVFRASLPFLAFGWGTIVRGWSDRGGALAAVVAFTIYLSLLSISAWLKWRQP